MGVRADVDTLAAKQAITEVLYNYCRGLDRIDSDLSRQCYHADGIDEHSGQYSGPANGWIEWVDQLHEPMAVTRHVLSNVLIEVSGTEAWSEAYWTVFLRFHLDGKLVDVTAGGRWLDYHRCVDGVWAIQRRRTVNDWHRSDEVVNTAETFEGKTLMVLDPGVPNFVMRRDRSDPSYDFLTGHRTEFEAA